MKNKLSENQNLVIASIQMTSNTNFKANLKKALSLILDAAKAGANLVVLPEYFAIMGFKETDKFEHVEDHGKGEMQDAISNSAIENNVWIVAGTHPITSNSENQPFGRCYVFQPDGKINCWYDKIHLFDVEVEDKTKSYLESKYSKPGNKPVSFETPWGRIGLAVCYDLRFPELYSQLLSMGAEILLVPSAFTWETGRAHWEILLRARAIENQCYVVGANQGGVHTVNRRTWGHSIIVDPWGDTLGMLDQGPSVLVREIDIHYLRQLRANMPIQQHKAFSVINHVNRSEKGDVSE